MKPGDPKVLAARMTAAGAKQGAVAFRAVAARDEEGPGHVIERKRGLGSWHFVGWTEDVKDANGCFYCYGERLA